MSSSCLDSGGLNTLRLSATGLTRGCKRLRLQGSGPRHALHQQRDAAAQALLHEGLHSESCPGWSHPHAAQVRLVCWAWSVRC